LTLKNVLAVGSVFANALPLPLKCPQWGHVLLVGFASNGLNVPQ
jgi:hypothetical protein